VRTVYSRSPLSPWPSTIEIRRRFAESIERRIRELRAQDGIDSRSTDWRTFDPPLDEMEPRRPLPIGYVDAGAKNGTQHRTKDARGRYTKEGT